MASAINPETVKKRAEEHLALNQVEDAVKILQEVAGPRRLRNQQVNVALEEAVILYVRLCISMGRVADVKGLLNEYKRLCTDSNDPVSLQRLIEAIREHLATHLAVMRSSQELEVHELEVNTELDSTMLFNMAFNNSSLFAKAGEEAKKVHSITVTINKMSVVVPSTMTLSLAVRMQYELYAMILDQTFRLRALEDCYFSAAVAALEIAHAEKRAAELRNLANVLKSHLSFLGRSPSRDLSNTDPLAPGYLTRAFNLRRKMFTLLMSLRQFREAFACVEEMSNLVRSLRQKTHLEFRAVLFMCMVEILQVAKGAELYHALALTRLHAVFKAIRARTSNVSAAVSALLNDFSFSVTDEQTLTETIVLAALASPALSRAADAASRTLTNSPASQPPLTAAAPSDLDIFATQRNREEVFAALAETSTLTSRGKFMQDLVSRETVSACRPAIRQLFALLSGDACPKPSVGKRVLALLNDSSLASLIAPYRENILRNAGRLTLSALSTAFQTLTVDLLVDKYLAGLFDRSAVLALVVDIAREDDFVALDHHAQTLVFAGSAHSSLLSKLARSARDMRTALSLANKTCESISEPASAESKALGVTVPLAQLQAHIAAERTEIHKHKSRRLVADFDAVAKRAEMIKDYERRRLEQSLEKEKEAKQAIENLRLEKEKAFKQAAALEAKKREEERKHQEELKQERERKNNVLVELRNSVKQGSWATKTAELPNGTSKKIEDITVEDLPDMTIQEIEKFMMNLSARERRERIKLRRAEARRLDFFVRALRAEAEPRLKVMEAKMKEEDANMLEEFNKMKVLRAEQQKQELIDQQELLTPALKYLRLWSHERN